MLRGFRWQFIAFIIAIVLFSISMIYRSTLPQGQTPTATAETPTQDQPTQLPTNIPSSTAPPTPVPSTPVAQLEVTQHRDNMTYREGIVGDVQRLNPIFAHLNPVDTDISSLIFEGLMKTNSFGEPVLNLASDMIVSSNGLEYVFTLRDDVRWQNGMPFTADDVVYTMSLLSSSSYEAYSPTATFWQTVETQKLADNLVRFRLTQPLGSFTSFLTIGILPEHALRGTTVDSLASHPFNLSPIGTGAYQLQSLNTTTDNRIDEVQLQFSPVFSQRVEAQSGYYYRKLHFGLYQSATTAINTYNAGKLDALANVAPRSELISLPASRIYTQVEPDVTVLLFNWEIDDRNVFADRRVRQALALSVNTQDIIERHTANDATFADSPLIPGSWAYQSNTTWNTFDVAAANQLLESANIEPVSGTDTETVENMDLYTFTILVEDSDPLPVIANDIAVQWRTIGFGVSVESVDSSILDLRLNTGDFQAIITTLPVGADPDVYRFWHPGQADDGMNYGRVNDNEISEVLELGRQENNGINRTTLYKQFQQRFAEQAIAIPLYYPLYTFVVRDSISGIQLGFLGTSADRFRNIHNWQPAPVTN